jgi:hypothetical protein
MLRFLRLFCEFCAGVLGILLILALIGIWRLNQAPLHSTMLTPNIEMAINRLLPGMHVEIAQSLLSWNNIDHIISLHLEGLRIRDAKGGIALEILDVDIATTILDLFVGQLIPHKFIAHRPFLRFTRMDDGRITFGTVADHLPGANSDSADSSVKFQKKLRHFFRHLPHTNISDQMEIDDTVIEIDDQNSKLLTTINLPQVLLSNTDKGPEGILRFSTQYIDRKATADLHYRYDELNGAHIFALHLDNFNPAAYGKVLLPTTYTEFATALDAPLKGNIRMDFSSRFTLLLADLELQSDAGILNYPAFWAQPRPIKSIGLKAIYDVTAPSIIGTAGIDFDGPTVDFTFTGKPRKLDPKMLDVSLGVKLQDWPMDAYRQLWPKSIIPDAYQWISSNLSKGSFDSGEGTFLGTLPLDQPDDFDLTKGHGTVIASGGRVTYVDGLPAVENVNANADFTLDSVTAHIASGNVANIKLLPFDIQMTDLQAHVQNIDIPLNVSATIPDIMRLLDAPPLGYVKAMKIRSTDIQGQATGIVDLKFPLIETLAMKDVDINAKGNLANVTATQLIPGIALTKGSLAVDLDKEGVTLTGPVAINDLPMQAMYRHNFKDDESKPIREGKLTGNLVDEQWTRFGKDVLKGSHGLVSFSIQFSQPNKDLFTLSGAADFTNADIVVDQLKWKKAAAVPAELKAILDMPVDKPINVKSIDLRSFNTNVHGSAVVTDDDRGVRLLKLDLPSFVMGRSNLSLHFNEVDDAAHTIIFTATGPALDLSGFKGNNDPDHSDARPREFHLKIDKLYTGDNNFISQAEGYAMRDSMGWNEINLHGKAQGSHNLEILLLPKEGGGKNFKVTSDNFGQLLQGLGITNTVKDGDLSIDGESSADEPRVVKGKVKIGSFVVTDLPVLAGLISAVTPFGFTDLLNRSASFDHLTSRFRWDGNSVDLIKLNAAGKSIGINADGKIDIDANRADLHGTLVPFSIVNRIIGIIPLLGDMITGGKGQGVLAVEYKLTGSLDSPNISVNPISLLTPGFVRNLFFGDGELADDKADVKPPAPPTVGRLTVPALHSP